MVEIFPNFAVSLARFVLGGVFLWSGGIKLKDLKGFALIASTYGVVPRFFQTPARMTSYLVPFSELVAGGLLFIGSYQLPALYFIAISLIIYTLLQSLELFTQGNVQNCGCYGTAFKVELSWKQVLKNLALLLLTVYLLASMKVTPFWNLP